MPRVPCGSPSATCAARGAAHPWLTITGELLLALGIVALSVALAGRFAGREAAVGCWLLAVAGTATAIQALAREDCQSRLAACRVRTRAGDVSWQHTLHELTSGFAFFLILAAVPVLARSFHGDPVLRGLAPFSTAAAIAGLALLVLFIATSDTAVAGLTERAFLVVPVAWIAVVGLRLGVPCRHATSHTNGL